MNRPGYDIEGLNPTVTYESLLPNGLSSTSNMSPLENRTISFDQLVYFLFYDASVLHILCLRCIAFPKTPKHTPLQSLPYSHAGKDILDHLMADPAGTVPAPCLDTTGSFEVADRRLLADLSHVCTRSAEGADDDKANAQPADLVGLEEIVARVKDFLQAKTQVLLSQNKSDPLLEQTSVYTINKNDLHGLITFITNIAIQRHKTAEESLPSASETKPSDPCPRIPKTMHSLAPTAVGPATTISVPQASFTSYAETADGAPQKPRRGSTTATILSRDSVTEITWMVGQGRLEAAGNPRHSPVGSDISRISRLSPGCGLDDTRCASQDEQLAIDRESGAGSATRPEPPVVPRDTAETQQRSSIVVTTSADEMDQQAEQEAENAERRMSTLARFRKKSIQLGQALGSFMNGDYRNEDHRPRRESTVARLQTALDRVEPTRPKHDAAIFGALTGAQPVGPVDHYNARRPGMPMNTCSEDGGWHTCVQHEANGCVQFSE